MSVYSNVRAGIRLGALKALSEFTNPQVIFSHLNGTEPAESYVALNILSIDQQGRSETSTFADQDRVLSVTSGYEVLVQFSFIGSQSGDMSQSFTQRINSNPLVIEELMRNSLGFMRKSQIRRAPQKRETGWVEYHNLDVTFSYIVRTQQLVDTAEIFVIQANSEPPFSVPPEYLNP